MMNVKDSTTPIAGSQAPVCLEPHSAFGKLSIVALLGATGTSGVLALTIGFPANTALLLIVTISLLGGLSHMCGFFFWNRWNWKSFEGHR